jgi:DNA-binding CsgD family transcriptional regulator
VAEALLAARGDARKVMAIFYLSRIPMTLLDGERRYVEVNGARQLMAWRNRSEMRRFTIDDLTPPDELLIMRAVWARMLRTGSVAGSRTLAGDHGVSLEVVYWGLANVLPGLHVFAFAPADWSEDELGVMGPQPGDHQPPAPLTPREREVLQLAAEGHSASIIAERLVLSPATVKTHLRNIHAKLGVSARAGAVATGIRLGLID